MPASSMLPAALVRAGSTSFRALGREPIGVQYAGAAHDPKQFANKRAEMYWDAAQWVKDGGALPDCPEILAAFPQTLYTFKGDAIILEPKEVIAEKIGYSPDHLDALITGFAEPVQPKGRRSQAVPKSNVLPEYDAFADAFNVKDR